MKIPYKILSLGLLVMIMYACGPAPEIHSGDRDVLVLIYQANPRNTLGWNIRSTDVSSWEGVEINPTGRLVKLTMIGKNIDSLPTEIGRLVKLKELKINFHELEEIPDQIGKLISLEKLDLSHANRLRSLTSYIGLLPKLIEFDLHFGNLTSIPPEIGNITTLRKLGLSWHFISELPPELGQLTELRSLFLYAINGSHMPVVPEELGRLTNLDELILAPDGFDERIRIRIPLSVCNLETIHGTEIDIYPRYTTCY